MKFDTDVIHAGETVDKVTGAVNIPIYQTSTYKQKTFAQHSGYEYSRSHNPTRDALERLVAELEEGTEGLAFASGMAAITTLFMHFKSQDHIIVSDTMYGGTYRLLKHVFEKFGLEHTAVDTTDVENIINAIKENTVATFIESPTNPLLSISDIETISTEMKRRNLLTIVDNTFMSPALQKPLTLGADIVVHSATKYLGGHSDVVAGVVVSNRPELIESLRFIQNAVGAILGPQDSFLLIRGIKTLGLRMERHISNTTTILDMLSHHANVRTVIHPSLTTHKNHNIFTRQSKGSVPIIAFELTDDIDIYAFGEALEVISVGESLGGVESLISHPASMTHASYPKATRDTLGITDTLLRLSVGVEDVEDLIKDLNQAIEKAKYGNR